jgi:hypothetical protein
MVMVMAGVVTLCMAMPGMILHLGFNSLCTVAALTIRAARSAFGCVWIQNLKGLGWGCSCAAMRTYNFRNNGLLVDIRVPVTGTSIRIFPLP